MSPLHYLGYRPAEDAESTVLAKGWRWLSQEDIQEASQDLIRDELNLLLPVRAGGFAADVIFSNVVNLFRRASQLQIVLPTQHLTTFNRVYGCHWKGPSVRDSASTCAASCQRAVTRIR